MRPVLVVLWMLLPLGAILWHLGPGVEGRARDRAARHVARAEDARAAGDHEGAVEAFGAALEALPGSDTPAALRIGIERAKARISAGQLAAASKELESLVAAAAADPAADPALVADAEDALATSDFYVAWLKRLEGQPREEWEPHAESARQTWRHLAETEEAGGDAGRAAGHARNLEAVVRLARMEPDELQGLPIPAECRNCKGGQCRSCRNPGKRPSPSAKKAKDARGASSGPPPDDSGS